MVEKNETKIFRGIVKLSSMIHNIDNIKDNYDVPVKMIRDLSNFDNWFDKNTNELMVGLFNYNAKTLQETIEWFDEYDSRYKAEESLEKQIVLLRSKMHSVINSLVQVEFPKELAFKTKENKDEYETQESLVKFSMIVCSRLQTILDKGYFKRLPVNHKHIEALCFDMDELGMKIIGEEKEIVA
jgi:hypothetical protein